MTRSWTSSLSLNTFDSWRRASTSVVLPWSTCVWYACCMLDGVKVAHCVAVGGRRESRWLDGVENARVSPGIACGRCYGTCATIATLRRPSSVDAAILRGALLRSCLAGRATRGRVRDTSALATPASIVILAIVPRRIVRCCTTVQFIVDARL
jgi:hypothetical protein